MPVTITLTDLEVENFRIYKITPEGGPLELGLSLNYTLTNSTGERKGDNRKVTLTPAQKTAAMNFIKPFVQDLGTELDVIIEVWAQP